MSASYVRLRAGEVELAVELKGLCGAEHLRSAFQPIFRASSGELEGCEALIRFPEGSSLQDPALAFALAARSGLLLALETAATLRHLRDARNVLGSRRLFLNVSAPLFSDPGFGAAWLAARVSDTGLFPGQIVLEITEIFRIRDFGAFHQSLEPFRTAGFQIAIDDFGAGYTNLRMITDLSPDFVKVDRVFIDGIASHARKRILVESVVTLCHRVNCSVIAEGIELPGDLETCLAAGVDYVQGFLFARPLDATAAFSAPKLTLPSRSLDETREDMRRLLVVQAPVSVDESIAAAAHRFLLSPRLRALPLVRDGRAVGLLKREEAAERLKRSEEGPADVSREPVGGWAGDEESFDRIPESALVEEAAALVRRRPEERRYDPLVVVGPNQIYRGLLEIDALLAELARLNVEYALQSNPVTRLPGRLVFERTLLKRLERKIPFTLARLNLRRFKHYNDRYGFLMGDDLLVHVASLLREALAGEPGSFVAHLADDDFAYIGSPETAEATAAVLVEHFDEGARTLHDPEDVASGGFTVRDRRGESQRIPLVGLSIGLVVWRGENVGLKRLIDVAEATLRGAENQQEGSSFLLNRRSIETATRLTASQIALPKPSD